MLVSLYPMSFPKEGVCQSHLLIIWATLCTPMPNLTFLSSAKTVYNYIYILVLKLRNTLRYLKGVLIENPEDPPWAIISESIDAVQGFEIIKH